MKNLAKIMQTVLLIATICFGTESKAQTSIDSTAMRALIVGRMMPQERVYLNFDNNAYYLGETMWFKASVVSGNSDSPTTLSKVLYVELVSPEGYVVETKKYKIDDGGYCNGEFELKETLLSGYYEVRAYTRYMRNWSDEAVFSRVFPIFDKVNATNWDFRNMLDRRRGFRKNGTWQTDEREDPTLAFFPESGNLVDGIESRVAYELLDAEGIGLENEIKIYADKSLLLTTTAENEGKGSFIFTPEKGVKYHAEVKAKNIDGKEKNYTFKLPEIAANGVVMNVTQDNDNVYIKVASNYTNAQELGIAILYRGNMGFFKKFKSNDVASYTLPKKELLEGVSRAVVFIDSIPLAERHFFVEHSALQKDDRETVKLNVKVNGYLPHNYTAKPHEALNISIEREDGAPIDNDAEFSIAVNDASGNQQTSWTHNQYTYMLLGSEIKGYIPNAAQYFDAGNSDRHAHLDLVMLTQGWTSYDWDKLTSNELSDRQLPEQCITLRGEFIERRLKKRNGFIVDTKEKKLGFNPVRLDIAYNDTVMTSVFRTDSLGRFIYEFDDFTGKRIVSLSPRTNFKFNENVQYAFILDRYISPAPRFMHYWERNLGIPSKKSGSKEFEVTKVNPLEFALSEIEIVENEKKQFRQRPPLSELHLDYLEEWEYATDKYYRGGRYQNHSADSLRLDEIRREYEDLIEEADIIRDQDTQGVSDRETENIETPEALTQEITERERMLEYQNSLTAYDVMLSAFRRHNLGWCYWIFFAVPKGEYLPGEAITPDDDYLKGKGDAVKMTNFKEIILRSDEKAVKSINNSGEGFWAFKNSAHSNKYPKTMFYDGFLSRSYIPPTEGENNGDGIANSYSAIINNIGNSEITRSMRNPNYVALFIPYDSTETKGAIVPTLDSNVGVQRFTSLQGYSESKRFYSPDYSKRKPTEAKDYRRTLIWEPEMVAEDGKLNITLYNSSNCENVSVSVNGNVGNRFYSNDATMQTRVRSNNVTGTVSAVTGNKVPEIEFDSIAKVQLAQEYELGEIYYRNSKYREAIVIFAELSQHSYPPALYSVATCYLNGRGIGKNLDLALQFMLRAAQAGEPRAQYEYAMMQYNGIGCERNIENTIFWLQEAVKRGENRAKAQLGHMYYIGKETAKDSAKAKELLSASASAGIAEGCYYYGLLLLDEGDGKNGVTNIEKGAEGGITEAQLYMMYYSNEQGNHKEAFKWAKELSMKDNAEGTYFLAECYLQGRGVKKDKGLGNDLMRQAAEQGFEKAKARLKE